MNQKKKKGLFQKKKPPVKKNGNAGTRPPSQRPPLQQEPRRKPVLFDQDAPVTRRQAPASGQQRMQETGRNPSPEASKTDRPVRPVQKKKPVSQKAAQKPATKKRTSLFHKKKSSAKPHASVEDIKRDANQSAEESSEQQMLRDKKKAEIGKRSQRKRRRMSAFYYIMLILFVLGVGVTLCLTVFFRIETVGVEGQGSYSSQQIRDAAGIGVGDNLLMIDADKAAKKVESLLPYAENVQIEKRLPSVVTITYEEASKAFAVEKEGQFIILSARYKVLEIVDEVPEGTVRIEGIELGDCAEGAQAVFVDEQEETLFREAADCIRDTGFTGLTELDLSEPANLSARFEDRVSIVFGTQQDLTAKLKLAQAVLGEKIGPNEKGTLTVSAVPRANFLPDYSVDEDSSEQQENPGQEDAESESSSETSEEDSAQ